MASGPFRFYGKIVAERPILVLSILALLTVGFGAGLLVDNSVQDATGAFLPPKSELAQAQEILAEEFPSSSTESVQLIVRGEVLSGPALQYQLDTFDAFQADPEIAGLLTEDPPVGVANLLQLIRTSNGATEPLASLSSAEVDALIASLPGTPFEALGASIQGLIVRDDLGRPTATLAFVTIIAGEEERELYEATFGKGIFGEAVLRMDQIAKEESEDVTGVDGRTFSTAKLNDEINSSQGSTTNFLMSLALVVILVVLALFYRSIGDTLIGIAGLVITLIWALGLQGILVQLNVIEPGNSLGIMVPVLLIGLCVDYGLQVTARYREERGNHASTLQAMRVAATESGVPLFLAAITTVVSFLTNLGSSLPPIQDFGLIAGVGVLSGWFVMTTFVPSMRSLLDQGRERKGKKLALRPLTDAIPGAGAAVGGLGRILVRFPLPVLGVVVLFTAIALYGAANVSTQFSATDFLPSDTESGEDLDLLSSFSTGGASATILVKTDLYDDFAFRQYLAFHQALDDVNQRPEGVTGPVQSSLLTLIIDLATPDAQDPTGRLAYDESVAEIAGQFSRQFQLSESQFTTLYLTIQEAAPEAFDRVFQGNPDPTTTDYTIIQVPIVSNDADATSRLVRELNRLWPGDEEQMTVTGGDVLSNEVVNAMTESQIQSVVLTIGAALVVLMIVFWVQERHAILGLITVIPIAIVVSWVLGTMYALGISYNVLTALITALTIGVGVDYTIHITHRFLEELREGLGIQHAVSETLRTVGGALLGSGLTTALGFGVLAFSPLDVMQQFGGLTALTIVYSLIASFVVLPPMLVLWALLTEYRAKVEDAPLPAAGGLRRLRCPKCHMESMVDKRLQRARCANPTCQFEGNLR